MSAGTDGGRIEITRGHNKLLEIEEGIATVAIGSPGIATSLVVRPNTIMLNGVGVGSTSLTLFTASGKVRQYMLTVGPDLTSLRMHLQRLDPRITVTTDPNGDAIVLSGTARSSDLVDLALEASIKFVGTITIAASKASNVNQPVAGAGTAAGPNPVPEVTESVASPAELKVVNLILVQDSLLSVDQRLERLLKEIDPRIEVEKLNSAFLLKGRVKTPSALARAISLADRFVNGGEDADISVISDKGGVLTGNTDEAQRLALGIPSLIGGRAQGNNAPGAAPVIRDSSEPRPRGGLGAQGGNTGQQGFRQPFNLSLPLMPENGNIARNIGRGDVVTAANGKVVSLLKVDALARVEIQMRIVTVDRGKTRDLGIDWSLNGNRVQLNTGAAAANNEAIQALAASSATGSISSLSITSFLRAAEDLGAAETLYEPLVSAVSGETASFLLGGTVPIYTEEFETTGGVIGGIGTRTRTLQYAEFGLRYFVRPTVLEDGRISTVLDQSISAPDYNVAGGTFKDSLGNPIPAFTRRAVSTLTESRDGETWAIAGLVDQRDVRNLSKVPFLSTIPIIGRLFQRQVDDRSRSELFIMVTARTVQPNEVQDEAVPVTAPELKPVEILPIRRDAFDINEDETEPRDEPRDEFGNEYSDAPRQDPRQEPRVSPAPAAIPRIQAPPEYPRSPVRPVPVTPVPANPSPIELNAIEPGQKQGGQNQQIAPDNLAMVLAAASTEDPRRLMFKTTPNSRLKGKYYGHP
ncbi:pilus assembly protein N-terminal domain-containing protein [Methylobacillus flagellatus]|uniref:pilus assembly protein N-terminal domain-containing protein n=1 Tax=Methylobacillus flagellatus TaxID=405 RepID=UPI001485AFB2|nr:pilus assembly protein N-terminal domain-containing protein [Methylobacillus flagellatus]